MSYVGIGRLCWMPLLLLPLTALAADGPDCSFAAPTGLLQARAYSAYAFQPSANNVAVELADISKDVKLEIRHSQCVDVVATKFTFKVKSSLPAIGTESLAVAFAMNEVSNLKLADSTRKPDGLLAFLQNQQKKGAAQPIRNFSACKDGATAPPGECSWDSLGGYIFEIKPQKEQTIISVTEYTSG